MPDFETHESLCRRCGRCCYEKLIVDGHVFTLTVPCRHLDEKTKLCRVYDRRHEENPRCLSVEDGIRWGVFPADCPYVRALEDYLPAEEGWLDDETAALIDKGKLWRWEDIAAEIERRGKKG